MKDIDSEFNKLMLDNKVDEILKEAENSYISTSEQKEKNTLLGNIQYQNNENSKTYKVQNPLKSTLGKIITATIGAVLIICLLVALGMH